MNAPADPNNASPLLEQLRQQFLDQLASRIAAIDTEAACLIRSAWNSASANRLHLMAHNLAGAAGTFGVPQLSQAARRLEQSLLPYLEHVPEDKTVRVNLHRNVMEVLYMAQDARQKTRHQEVPHVQPHPASSPLVYLVEDNPELCSSIATYLQDAGYQVRCFSNPEELLALADAIAAPQVLIMDMIFPQENTAGGTALEAYRARYDSPFPAICISVNDDIETRLRAVRAGATRYLAKPLDLERLVRILDDLTDCRVHNPYCVLMVDDDRQLLDLHAHALRSAGMRVVDITDPLQALPAAQECFPDVIVLDVRMPGISGIELAALLRDDDSFDDIPILFLSTETNVQYQMQALDLGGDDYLLKPIEPEHLVSAVRTRAKRARHAQIVGQNLRRILREKEFQEYAVNQHAIISVTNASGEITKVNERFCEVSGYAAAELIGQHHRIVKSGEHAPAFYRDMWETISSGRVWRGVVCNRRKNGGLYWVESTIVPFLDQNQLPVQYISIRTDVTDILHAESALRSERHLTEAAINALPGIFYLISAEQRFLRVNETFHKVTGYTQQELELASPLKLFAQEDRNRIAQRMQEAFEFGYSSADVDLVTKAGERIPYYFEGARVMIEGRPCLIGTGMDMRQIKRYQSELIMAKEEAEKASNAKTQFLSNISHELRTPMNAILGFAQLSDADADLNADQRDNIQEILKAGQHLLALINDILDLSRIEAGRIDLAMEIAHCQDLFQECISLIQPLAEHAQIALSQQNSRGLAVRADRRRLKQALINLLSNAVKYGRPHGHVTLGAALVPNARVRISVIDDGLGIPENLLPELFQPFNRLHLHDSKTEGTGIGLTITKRLVQAMGGEIGVESIYGKGSRFWIELPMGVLDEARVNA